jgi:hypothetical protein
MSVHFGLLGERAVWDKSKMLSVDVIADLSEDGMGVKDGDGI